MDNFVVGSIVGEDLGLDTFYLTDKILSCCCSEKSYPIVGSASIYF